MMDTLFAGKTALITGASGGIGRALVRALVAHGVDVVALYGGNHAAMAALVAELRPSGRRVQVVSADLAGPDLSRALDDAEAFGPIDILINNAGNAPRQALHTITVEDWDRVLAVHLRASFLLAQRFAPGMQARGWGRIVFISSLAALTGGIIGPHYAAAKAGQLGLMHWLANALAPAGVTVNAVAPALIAQTGMISNDDAETFAQRIPVRRLGQPEEVAQLVLSVLANGYLSGQTIVLDGGVRPT
jgi:3-oxoacyl-[acyl-carrier protein] reductase